MIDYMFNCQREKKLLLLADVQQSLREYIADMFVIQRIVHDLAILAILDKSCLPQRAKLMRYSGLCHSEQNGDVTDAHLRILQRAEYPNASRIAEYLKQVGQVQKNLILRHLPAHLLDDILMYNVAVALLNLIGYASHIGSPLKTND
jgi:hypothetical protein